MLFDSPDIPDDPIPPPPPVDDEEIEPDFEELARQRRQLNERRRGTASLRIDNNTGLQLGGGGNQANKESTGLSLPD